MFAICVFVNNNNSVAAVPTKWLVSGTECRWPLNASSKKVAKMIRREEDASTSWPLYKIREIASRFDDPDKIREMEKRAEVTSDAVSEEEERSKTRKRKDSSSSSEDSIVFPPQPLASPVDPAPAVDRSGSCSCQKAVAAVLDEVRALSLVVATIAAKTDALLHKMGVYEPLLIQIAEKDSAAQPPHSSFTENLPITNLEDFDLFEERLKSAENSATDLESHLSLLGGGSLQSLVRNCLEVLLSTDLQLQFNWEGKSSPLYPQKCKRGFRDTVSCTIITNVILKKPHLHADHKMIGKTILNYLKNARDRGMARKRCRTREVQPLHPLPPTSLASTSEGNGFESGSGYQVPFLPNGSTEYNPLAHFTTLG